MRRGFSLPELMLTLALVGILLAIALPPLSGALDRIEVQAAANQLAAAHQRARLMAVTRGLVLVLAVDQNEISISTRGQEDMLWSGPGPGVSGVVLAGGTRKFTFSPEGLTLGLSNATLRLVRGSATRSVVVSRLGRVRITH
jgi:prepilin-type N-terminal cleavage/methylation domain-containing protein